MGLAGSTALAAKPSIAVLGLEVVDPSGTPTPRDTEVAKQLTNGLRQRARAGTGMYQYAPGSEKELIDEKLLNNCNSEAVSCMVAIGHQVGADRLIYGKIERLAKGYQVTIQLLDVTANKRERPIVELIPLSEASGADLQVEAKRIYAKLTGETGAGSLVVKVSGADRGTIYIDGNPQGTITSGTGEVSGLSEGRHRLAVEVGGFRRWEKTITISAGQTTNVPVDDLERSGHGEPGGGAGDGSGSGIGIGAGTGPIVEHHGNHWKAFAVGGAIATGALAVGWGIYASKLHGAGGGLFSGGSACIDQGDGTFTIKDGVMGVTAHDCQVAKDAAPISTAFSVATIAAAAFTGFAIYEAVRSHGGSSSEHAKLGHREHRNRFVITPVISPDGGGATLRFDW